MKQDIEYLQNEINIARTQLHLLEGQLREAEGIYNREKRDTLCKDLATEVEFTSGCGGTKFAPYALHESGGGPVAAEGGDLSGVDTLKLPGCLDG
jgi:hypothetical protein